MSESAHTITMIPERTNTPKVYSKRDVKTSEQKARVEKRKEVRRAILFDTTCSSDSQAQPKRRKAQVKKGENNNPEIAFDLERESCPPIIEISSTATEDREEKEPGPVTKKENGDTGSEDTTHQKRESPYYCINFVGSSKEWANKNVGTQTSPHKKIWH